MAYNKLSMYKTAILHELNGMAVQYHQTKIVSWDQYQITLRTGGWDSVTTRRKMNQTSIQFGLGFGVWRRKGITYVKTPYGAEAKLGDGVSMVRHV